MEIHGVGVRLLTDNLPALFDFYTGVIGFRAVWGDRNGQYAAFAEGRIDKPALAVFARRGMADYAGYAPQNGRGDSVALCVGADDVDAAYRELKAKGVNFMGEPRDMPGWEMRCVYFRDPDGNLFELAGEMRR